ncbi:hypothetical protein RLIN73S_00599 [Rhodanobacter lindaniclasticus]
MVLPSSSVAVAKRRSFAPTKARLRVSCHCSSLTRTLSVLCTPSTVDADTYVNGGCFSTKACSAAAPLPLPSTSRRVSPWVARTTLACTDTLSRT